MTKKITLFSLSLTLYLGLWFSFSSSLMGAGKEEITTSSKATKVKKIGPKAVLFALLWSKGVPNLPDKLIHHLWQEHPERECLEGKEKPKPTNPIGTFFRELSHGVFGGGLTAAVMRKIAGPCQDDPNLKKGLVLIHGTGVTPQKQWPSVERWLKKAGIKNVLSVNYNSKQKVKASCKEVWEQIRERFPSDYEIVLIGHSQGGLVARALVDHEECRESENKENPKIISVFCLNAPLKGAPMVDLLAPHLKEGEEFHEAYQDMSINSAFIQKLEKGIYEDEFSVKAGIEIFELASENDTFVHPAYSISFAPNSISISTPKAGHFTIAFYRDMWLGTLIPRIKKYYVF